MRDLAAALSSVALFAFLLNFVWEMLQTPFFAQMPFMPHWDMTLICLAATLGDVGIAIIAYAVGALSVRRPLWLMNPSHGAGIAYLATGMVITTGLEWHALATGRWAYSDLMPSLPLTDIGLVPIVQWALLPPLVLTLARRQCGGSALDLRTPSRSQEGVSSSNSDR